MPDETPVIPDPNRARYEEAVKFRAAQYQDVIERLAAEALPCHFTQTGGMNAALEVTLDGERVLIITDDGSYGPPRFEPTKSSSSDALLDLLPDVLFGSSTEQ